MPRKVSVVTTSTSLSGDATDRNINYATVKAFRESALYSLELVCAFNADTDLVVDKGQKDRDGKEKRALSEYKRISAQMKEVSKVSGDPSGCVKIALKMLQTKGVRFVVRFTSNAGHWNGMDVIKIPFDASTIDSSSFIYRKVSNAVLRDPVSSTKRKATCKLPAMQDYARGFRNFVTGLGPEASLPNHTLDQIVTLIDIYDESRGIRHHRGPKCRRSSHDVIIGSHDDHGSFKEGLNDNPLALTDVEKAEDDIVAYLGL